jgi:hypothetical protein
MKITSFHPRSALCALSIAAVLSASAGSLAQPKGKADAAAGQPKAADAKPLSVFVMEHAGLDKLLVDPKDKALAGAVSMLPARVRELPRELHGNMPPAAVSAMNLVLATIARPARVTITYNAENPAGGAFGYGAVVSFEAKDQQDAEQLQAQVGSLLAMTPAPKMGKPGQRWKTMTDVQTPVGMLSYGPREGKQGWRYDVIFGSVDAPEAGLEVLPAAPEGIQPVLRARFDLAGLGPAMDMAGMMGAGKDPRVAEQIAKAKEAGFGGPDSVKVSYVTGYTKTENVAFTTFEHAAKMGAMLMLPKGQLSGTDLASVPADAYMATISKQDLSFADRLLDQLAEHGQPVQAHLDEFQAHTGVDLREDIIHALGGTVALYTSDSTGGGSIASVVAMISFKDRARFMAAQAKLTALANTLADQIPIGPGYVRFKPWKDGETDLVSLRFPGLPVPLELTYALTRDWLILSPTPQGAIAAARQATGRGDQGLTANPSFAAAWPKGKAVTRVSFIDSPRTMRMGYPILSLAGSAVANAVRSPTDPEREPGLVVPTYNELREGARARLSYGYWRGDDFVSEMHTDRSVLVNASSALGAGTVAAPLIAAMIAGGFAAQQHQQHRGGGGRAMEWLDGPVLADLGRAVEVLGPGILTPSVERTMFGAGFLGEWVLTGEPLGQTRPWNLDGR